jgi:hypothetical protein
MALNRAIIFYLVQLTVEKSMCKTLVSLFRCVERANCVLLDSVEVDDKRFYDHPDSKRHMVRMTTSDREDWEFADQDILLDEGEANVVTTDGHTVRLCFQAIRELTPEDLV